MPEEAGYVYDSTEIEEFLAKKSMLLDLTSRADQSLLVDIRDKFVGLHRHLRVCKEQNCDRIFKIVVHSSSGFPVDDVILSDCDEIVRFFHSQMLHKISWYDRVAISNCVEQSSDSIMFKVTFKSVDVKNWRERW